MATTRSPTSKRRLPRARVEPRLERRVEGLGAGRPAVHRRDDLHLLGRDAQRARDRVGDQLHHPVGGLGRPACRHDDDLAGGVVDRRQLAAAHRRRQPGDRAALGLPVQRVQLGDRHDAGVDQVAEHPARADRGQLRGVADEQQVGAVLARGQQRGGQLDVEHRRLVDHDQVLVERQSSPRAKPPSKRTPSSDWRGCAPSSRCSVEPARRTVPRAAWRRGRSGRRGRRTCPRPRPRSRASRRCGSCRCRGRR